MKPKKELVRIVRDKEGTIRVDLTGKKSGRGAYICRSSDCLSKARKGRKLDKALETAVDEAVYTVLEEQMGENNA